MMFLAVFALLCFAILIVSGLFGRIRSGATIVCTMARVIIDLAAILITLALVAYVGLRVIFG